MLLARGVSSPLLVLLLDFVLFVAGVAFDDDDDDEFVASFAAAVLSFAPAPSAAEADDDDAKPALLLPARAGAPLAFAPVSLGVMVPLCVPAGPRSGFGERFGFAMMDLEWAEDVTRRKRAV